MNSSESNSASICARAPRCVSAMIVRPRVAPSSLQITAANLSSMTPSVQYRNAVNAGALEHSFLVEFRISEGTMRAAQRVRGIIVHLNNVAAGGIRVSPTDGASRALDGVIVEYHDSTLRVK